MSFIVRVPIPSGGVSPENGLLEEDASYNYEALIEDNGSALIWQT